MHKKLTKTLAAAAILLGTTVAPMAALTSYGQELTDESGNVVESNAAQSGGNSGGGFYENIPRSIPDGFGARIKRDSVKVLPIFDLIAKKGNICERDMFNTFNMGVGMSVVVPASDVDTSLEILKASGVDAYVIGDIIESEEKITFC